MYTLKVEKMSCCICIVRVSRAVQALDPHAKVKVRLKDRLVAVDSAEALGAVANALTTAGFPATQAEGA